MQTAQAADALKPVDWTSTPMPCTLLSPELQYEMSWELRQQYAAFKAEIPYIEEWYRQRQWGMGREFEAFRQRQTWWELQCQESGNGNGNDKNNGKIEQRQCDEVHQSNECVSECGKVDKAAGEQNMVYHATMCAKLFQ